jgi:outer membrane scaffolding protein for murein synthesis (MipA/OmpV family)
MVIGGGLAKESGTLDLDAERDERNDRTKGSDKRFGGRDEAHVGAAQIGGMRNRTTTRTTKRLVVIRLTE